MTRRSVDTEGFPELLDDVSKVVLLSDLDERLARSERLLCTEVVERALYKDLPHLERVDDSGALERLLYNLAGKLGDCLRFEDLGNDLPGSNPLTLERMLKQLERAQLLFTSSSYTNSEREARHRAKRLFFVDGAVRNAVLARGVGPLRDPEEMALLIVNLVAVHLRALAKQTDVRLCCWGESDHQVDFVYPAVAIDLPESIEFGPVGPDSIDVQASPRKSPVVRFARRQPIWLSRTKRAAGDFRGPPDVKSYCNIGVYDHPEEPLAFAIGTDSDRARRALALFAERHPDFHGRCWHVSPLVAITHPTAAPDAIGAVPLDLFLLALAKQNDQEIAWDLGD